MEAPLAAVTGGTGFLGGHIISALLAQGWRVRALVRRPPAAGRWTDAAVEPSPGELRDADSLARLCRGAQVVVHAAGAITARTSAHFADVNVAGTARLATAARGAAPGAPFVLVSSLAAREPALSLYARSKRDGEAAAQEVLGGSLRIARPCALYGPGDRATLTLFQAATASPVLPVLSRAARICLMHGGDAGRAVAAMARHPAAGPVELSDARAEGYAWREIMAAAAAAVGAQPRLVPVPRAAVQALGLAGDALRLLGGRPVLTSGKAREVLHGDWSVRDAPRAIAPVFDLASGFRDAVRWYRAEDWLSGPGGRM